MKKIEAIIRSHKLEEVKTAILSRGVIGMTISELRQFGRQKGLEEQYRGVVYSVDFQSRLKVEVVVNDDQLSPIIDALVNSAQTGEVGDGKIFISSVSEIVRIRTGETNLEAI
ncbi:nitrogen regulatory protein P-II [Gloeothece citriformis PCC 7424]|uniref:Nitrogen regulatory protein P-II n=1 Tax=Gloeothece citriformis (strain PCC 7424) TaxID=65393 RepID=B7K9P5_GLOC7|nr:P-II family nitrogen regulator [Gloeothece citriformis]ACK70013.1 nitrogen regulatory protein P-II [Gloeothece citriformis PCC 7424]